MCGADWREWCCNAWHAGVSGFVWWMLHFAVHRIKFQRAKRRCESGRRLRDAAAAARGDADPDLAVVHDAADTASRPDGCGWL